LLFRLAQPGVYIALRTEVKQETELIDSKEECRRKAESCNIPDPGR